MVPEGEKNSMNDELASVPKNPNPQGKGLVPVLQDWGSMQTGVVRAKSAADFLRDYCVSSLVIAAKFRFKPVVGNTYYLYAGQDDWTLSLIAPHEWNLRKTNEFLASCRLRRDMTWEMEIVPSAEGGATLARAKQFIQGFVETLSEQDSISENLPLYVGSLPYYQRMLATALSSSLQRSLPPTGDNMKALLSELPEHTALLGQSLT